MAAGKKANNLTIGNPNFSWEDLYGIAAGSLTNATRDNFQVLVLNNRIAICFYTGSGALTTSQFAAFPKGSIIFCSGLATPALYFKTANATDTWKYQAINT